MKRMTSFLLMLALLLAGCGTVEEPEGSETPTEIPEAAFIENDTEMFTDRDARTEYEESGAVAIQLNGSSVSCSSEGVEVSGTTVTIKQEATYVLSGTLDDGMIIVDTPDTAKPQLIFNGVSITSATSAPLYIPEADKVFVTLAEGTENTLANGGTFTAIDENNIDAAVFSKQDLTFNGSGSLAVTSPAGHGIVSKDDLVITGGTYAVTSASHGLDANDSVRITNAAVTVASGKDGIHAENSEDASLGYVYISSGTFDIDAEGDGISASFSLQIEDGTFDIVSGGGSENAQKENSDSWGMMGGGMGGMGGMGPGGMQKPGMRTTSVSTETTEEDSSTSLKGLKSTGSMQISDGTFTINSADDAVHSDASVTVNGGTFRIASGDDAFHAEETLTINAGSIDISESYEGLEALDIAVSGGDIKLVASDDGLNAAGGADSSGTAGGRDAMFGGGPGGMGGGMGGSSDGSIVITGGTLYVNASGDGIDANGTITISGGHTTVAGPTQGDTATLDYDTTATISGGTFIGTGASGMAQTFSDSEQGVIALSTGNTSAGTAIKVADPKGNELFSYEPELNFAVFIFSSPEIEKGVTYTVTNGTSSGEFEAN
ncbi:MAG: carbohydrate-binding domain-containing protein [Clostridia bacterium]|nr:carbohydrate-binding domain-containing protein [Clostridia bacterium]